MAAEKAFRKKGGLTKKQELFCERYTTHWNATRAAKEAGFSDKTAHVMGHRLVNKGLVSEKIKTLGDQALKDAGVSRERILAELVAVATADMTEAFDEMGQMKPFSEMPENVRRSLNGVEVHEIFAGQGDQRLAIGLARKFKAYDKNKALEILAKHLKLLTDRVEHSGPNGGPIEHRELGSLSDEQLEARIVELSGNNQAAEKK